MYNSLIIDLGTNTVIFSLVKVNSSELIITYEKSITTRIGENIFKDDCISQESLDRNIKVISSEVEKIKKEFDIDSIFAMTTEALRCAKNASTCVEKINSSCKIKLETITGEEEAIFMSQAVAHTTNGMGKCIICDIGGGSTEFATIIDGKMQDFKSVQLGVVRLEEEFGLSKNAQNTTKAVDKIKQTIPTPTAKDTDLLILCGGTATTTAAIILELKAYDPKRVEAFELSRHDLNQLLNKLSNSNLDQIRDLLPSDKARADVITAGVLEIISIINTFNPKKIMVSTFGPRHGFAMNKLNLKNIKQIKYEL